MVHTLLDIEIAKERVKIKRALRRRYIPFCNTMKTDRLIQLCDVFGIQLN